MHPLFWWWEGAGVAPEPEPETRAANLLDTFAAAPRAILINSRPRVDSAGVVKLGGRPTIKIRGY